MDNTKVINYYKKLKERLQPGRVELLRGTYENILFWLGNQWVQFDPTFKGFRRTNTAANVPRPVTNLFKAKLGKVISMLSAIEPGLSIAPGTDADDDRLTADAAKPVINYLERSINIDALRLELAFTVAVCNNAWTWVDFDTEGGSLKRVPKWECQQDSKHSYDATSALAMQLKCPEDDAPLLPSQTKFTEETEGAVSAAVLTAFDLWCDYTLRMDEQVAVFHRRMRPVEWMQERYPGRAKREPTEVAAADLGLTYKQNIIRLAPALGGLLGGSRFSNQILVDDMRVMPCKDFPKGLLARIAAEEDVLEAKELPFHDGPASNPGRRLLAVGHWGYDAIPASPMLCTGPADFLKSPQRERNRTQSHMMLYAARSANGVWYLPEGINVAQLSGIEGTVLRGNTTAAGGGEPKRIEAGRAPTYWSTRLAEIEEDMNQIIMIESLHDQAPRVDNARAIALLQQERQQSLNPVYRRWGGSYAEFGRQLFYVFRSFAPEEIWYKVKGEEARWSMKKVREADLRGGVDINVESGTIEPKTSLQKQAMVEQMVEYQLVDLTEPSTRIKVSRLMGGSELLSDYAADEAHIAREQAAVLEWAKQNFDPKTGAPKEGVDLETLRNFPILMDPDLDFHALHIPRHRIWMLSEEFQALPPAVQQMFRTAHYNAHRQAEMQAQAMQAAADAEAAAPQQGAGSGASGKSKSKSKSGKAASGGSEKEAA